MNVLKLLGGKGLAISVVKELAESFLEKHFKGLDSQDALEALDQLQALLAKVSDFCDWLSDRISVLEGIVKPIHPQD